MTTGGLQNDSASSSGARAPLDRGLVRMTRFGAGRGARSSPTASADEAAAAWNAAWGSGTETTSDEVRAGSGTGCSTLDATAGEGDLCEIK